MTEYQVVMGSALDPAPDHISHSSSVCRFDSNRVGRLRCSKPLSTHAHKQLLKLSRVLERLFFTRPPHPVGYFYSLLARISSLYSGRSAWRFYPLTGAVQGQFRCELCHA